jgi:hypothetical protein
MKRKGHDGRAFHKRFEWKIGLTKIERKESATNLVLCAMFILLLRVLRVGKEEKESNQNYENVVCITFEKTGCFPALISTCFCVGGQKPIMRPIVFLLRVCEHPKCSVKIECNKLFRQALIIILAFCL